MKMYIMKGRTKGSIGNHNCSKLFTIYFLVERYNRTIKTRLQRSMTESKSKIWINVLSDMTKNINATVNRSIGISPDQVTFEKVPEISARLYEDRETKPCKFSLGDHVRIPREKNLFSKGYTQNWSDGIYTIHQIQSSLGICYFRVLDSNKKEVNRSFYESELNLVATRK